MLLRASSFYKDRKEMPQVVAAMLAEIAEIDAKLGKEQICDHAKEESVAKDGRAVVEPRSKIIWEYSVPE